MKSKFKKITAIFIISIMIVGALSGCGTDKSNDNDEIEFENGIEINILSRAGQDDTDVTLMRDFLTKAGFIVNVNIQPDHASQRTQIEAGNFDLAIASWTISTGTPDYAVRGRFHSNGSSNLTGMNDPRIDELIDLGASQTPEEYMETYAMFEKEFITDNAYIIPLYRTNRTVAINTTVVKPESVSLANNSLAFELFDFADESLRDTQPLNLSQNLTTIASFDTARDAGLSTPLTHLNTYVRLVNNNENFEAVPDGSLSWQFAIAEGNTDFYFILRDDINFAKVENMSAVDTGVRVGGEDVVFSISRSADKNAVPDHRSYSIFEEISGVSMVTDISVLDAVKDTTTGKSIREIMEQRTPSAISSLTGDKTEADNSAGVYQVVKITTRAPFPQILNHLAHSSAGILSEQQVKAVDNFTVEEFDRNVHIPYGDEGALTLGATYDHHLWASGPYIPVYKDDYELVFEKNSNYMRGTEWEPRIKNINLKLIADKDAEISAFRSGVLHVLNGVPTAQYDLISNEANTELIIAPSMQSLFWMPNLNPGSKMLDENLRKAIFYAINQDDILAAYHNKYFKSYSVLSPILDFGNEHVHDMSKVAEYVGKYLESQGK